MRLLAWAGAATLAVAVVAGCSTPNVATMATSTTIPAVPGSLDGAYEPGLSYDAVAQFGVLTDTTPNLVLYYSGWYEKFQTQLAAAARTHDAYLLVQLNPNGVSLASVAAGKSDRYLRSYAQAVKGFGFPVILSFGHEMNGWWYPWGVTHANPAQFIAAWRHVVQVFRNEGATNVRWLWTVAAVNYGQTDVARWWPGASWVNWVGVDGYYYRPSDTFASVFSPTLAEVRRFTDAPLLIAETAVGPNPEAASQVKGLFAGIRANRLLGEVWFDEAQHDGIYHQDWRLEDDAAAMQAFKFAARKYLDR